ncbi:MAG: hypothetical protein IKH65_08700 [Clostridia bacterium]|nr:hypothetical protein [Clostridia bacterium]
MSKKKKALLITAGLLILIGLCIGSVGIYAHRLINQPKYYVPEERIVPAVKLPKNNAEKLEYLIETYNAAFCDETLVSKNVSIDVPDDKITSSMNEADSAVLKYLKSSYVNYADSLYKEFEDTPGNKVKDKRDIDYILQDFDSFEVRDGVKGDDGTVTGKETRYFEMTLPGTGYTTFDDINNKLFNTFGISENKGVIDNIIGQIAPMAEVIDRHIELNDCSVSGKINALRNKLTDITFIHTYTVDLTLQFTGAYSDLGVAEISFDYTVKEDFTFKWFDAYFTSKAIYMNPKDEKDLPVSVFIPDSAAQDEYKLSFKSSDPESVTVGERGNVSAIKASSEPVEITSELKFKGHTFTDKCYVTVTELELEVTQQ